MPNGLSSHDSGQGSRDNDPQVAAALPEDEDISEDEDTGVSEDEALELDFADDVDDLQDLSDDTDSELLTAESEVFVVATPRHPIRAIEAHWEAKRLDAMLREVYDEE
ncbi:MAG: hypothetical protein ACREVE_08240 [Gammaproteobacteria bacterium]